MTNATLAGFKVAYTPSELKVNSPLIWNKDVFKSNDETVCPITSCARYLTGCDTPITGLTNMMFLKNAAGGIYLNVASNTDIGWKETVCIVCTNGDQKISVDNYTVEQGNVCANGFKV